MYAIRTNRTAFSNFAKTNSGQFYGISDLLNFFAIQELVLLGWLVPKHRDTAFSEKQ